MPIQNHQHIIRVAIYAYVANEHSLSPFLYIASQIDACQQYCRRQQHWHVMERVLMRKTPLSYKLLFSAP